MPHTDVKIKALLNADPVCLCRHTRVLLWHLLCTLGFAHSDVNGHPYGLIFSGASKVRRHMLTFAYGDCIDLCFYHPLIHCFYIEPFVYEVQYGVD